MSPSAKSENSPLTLPKRGSLGIRLIAGFKFTSGILLLGVGFGIFKLLSGDVGEQLTHWSRQLHADPGNKMINTFITNVSGVDRRYLKRAEVGTFIYSGFLLVEGVGLYLEKRWAEYLTVIATSSLLPIELYEVFEKGNVLKVVVLFVNLAAVVYLVRRLRRESKVLHARIEQHS